MSEKVDILEKCVFNISLVLNCEDSNEAEKIVKPLLSKIRELKKANKILEYTVTEWSPGGRAEKLIGEE